MEVILSIVVQLIGGGIGGNVIAQIARSCDLGPAGNSLAGAVGGVILTWIAQTVPALEGLLGEIAPADPSAAGIDSGALAGQGISGVVGGVILTAIVGAIKSRSTAK